LGNKLPGFDERREGNSLLFARSELAEYMTSRPLEDLLLKGEEVVLGRRSHSIINLPGASRAVVRYYVHGGLFRKVTGDRFAGSERFFEEVRVSEHLRSHNVNTPEVLGLLIQAGKLGFKRGALVTRMVEGGSDLLNFFKSKEGREQVSDPAFRRDLLKSAARVVRSLHDAGVYHRDLHVKNMLLAPEGKIFILDLDRAVVLDRLSRRKRLANLVRLGRSVEKTGLDSILTGRDTYMFFLEYLRSGKPLKIDRREAVSRYMRHVARHRLFWKMGIR